MALMLPPFALERWFAPREFVARHHASSSDCEPLSLADVVARAEPALRTQLDALTLGYTDTRGGRALREAIAPLHGVGADDVLCVTPSEGIALTMLALCKPGDVVVVAMPAYQSLFEVARAQGAVVRAWMPREDHDAWRFDPDDLAKLVDGAALVVVNFPHNPTGAYPSRAEWDAIVALCRRSGARLFSDEMYRLLEAEDVRVPSAASAYERGVALGGLSKSLSAPGLRQGWLASTDRALLDAVAALKDYTTICGNVVGEHLAFLVVADHDRIARENRARIADNAAAVDQMIARRSPLVSWKRPRAGSTALLRFGDERLSATALSEALFRERSVLLLPATIFDFGDRHARLGLGRHGFAAALAHVEAHLS